MKQTSSTVKKQDTTLVQIHTQSTTQGLYVTVLGYVHNHKLMLIGVFVMQGLTSLQQYSHLEPNSCTRQGQQRESRSSRTEKVTCAKQNFLFSKPTFTCACAKYTDLCDLIVSKEEFLAQTLSYSHCLSSVLLDSLSSMWCSLDLHSLLDNLPHSFRKSGGGMPTFLKSGGAIAPSVPPSVLPQLNHVMMGT